MRKAKWIFISYMGVIVLIVAGIAISFSETPPRDPQTVYLPLAGAVKSLDPAEVNDTIAAPLVGSVYECLYNYKFGVDPYEIFPELASAMPEVSADNLTLTIKLRPGIHFFDPQKLVFPTGVGPELKAADVEYTFKRICDFNLASPNYSAIFEGNFAGLESWWDYTQKTRDADIDWDKPIESFRTVDDHTIQLKLSHPNPQMIYHLAHEPTGIVCRQVVEYWRKESQQHGGIGKFRRHPVGTGPYALVQYLPDQRLVYEVNPLYRGRPDIDGTAALSADDPNRLPHIKRFQYDYFDEELPVWLLFNQGLFDVAGIPKDSFREAVGSGTGDLTPEMARKGVVLLKHVEPVTEYIGFNMQDSILGKNKPLRQAMSLAFDRRTYIENFLNGRGSAAIGLIPPSFPTFDPTRINPFTQYDPKLTKAIELMKEAERINGGPIPPLTVLMRDADTLSTQMAEYFSSQMRTIGVTLKPEFRDFARWNEMVDNRQTQVFDAGWQADYPDEQNFLQLLYSKNIPNGGLNSTCYSNPQFDAMYEKAAVMQDSPERRALYIAMEKLVMDDCPMLLECYPKRYQLRYDWIGHYHLMDYGYGSRQYFTLDESLRQKRFANHAFAR